MKPLIPALFAGGLLLAAQTCFAEDQWADPGMNGPRARTELAAIGENGRTAFRNALIACSLYVDEPLNARQRENCKTAFKGFELEFGNEAFLLSNLLGSAVLGTDSSRDWIAEFHTRPPNHYQEKATIADLQKVYRETALHPSLAVTTPNQPSAVSPPGTTVLIPLQQRGGARVVAVLINKAITLNFVVDSGAADVSIPTDVVMTLIRTGTLQDADFIGKETYKLADGSTVPSMTFRIRSLKANSVEIENVKASIAPAAGELLLGQDFLSRFKSWSIDNAKQALVLAQ